MVQDSGSHSLTGATALSLFFGFGTLMCSLTATMLLFPGSVLEPLWRLHPSAQQGFAGLGAWAILLMVIVGTACAVAAFGLWRCTRLGYRTAVAILCLNTIGDLTNALTMRHWWSLIGLPIGGAMIWYLVGKRHLFAC